MLLNSVGNNNQKINNYHFTKLKSGADVVNTTRNAILHKQQVNTAMTPIQYMTSAERSYIVTLPRYDIRFINVFCRHVSFNVKFILTKFGKANK